MNQNAEFVRRETSQQIPRFFAERDDGVGHAAHQVVDFAAMVLDRSGVVRYCNTAALRLFRTGGRALVGQHVTTRIPGLPFKSETPGYNVAYATLWAATAIWLRFSGVDSQGRSLNVHVSLNKFELEGHHQILLILRPAAESQLRIPNAE